MRSHPATAKLAMHPRQCCGCSHTWSCGEWHTVKENKAYAVGCPPTQWRGSVCRDVRVSCSQLRTDCCSSTLPHHACTHMCQSSSMLHKTGCSGLRYGGQGYSPAVPNAPSKPGCQGRESASTAGTQDALAPTSFDEHSSSESHKMHPSSSQYLCTRPSACTTLHTCM